MGSGPPAQPAREAGSSWLEAGRVGRAHGLDGSFYVTGARPRLLSLGNDVTVADRRTQIVRRAGTDARPILRVEGVQDRGGADALRGLPVLVHTDAAPSLQPGEFWAHELQGCAVLGDDRLIGTVRRMIELPSCEALEVQLSGGGELLVPMVRDAVRSVDVRAGRIEVDLAFLGLADGGGAASAATDPIAPPPRGDA